MNVQHGHGIACENYKVSPVMTGYESTIADRVESGFAATAKQGGTVISVRDKGVIVQYDDGTKEGFEVGRRYGASAGMTIPHDLVANVKTGQKFKAGDVLTYHKGFFKPDTFDKTKVHWMNGTIATVALLESRKTHEDACSVSAKFGDELVTEVTSVKKIMINFNQQIHKLVKIGDEVKYGQELCFIEDSVTSSSDLFSEDTLNTLRYFSGQAPTSKVAGRVDNIEVYYHGHPDDMSSTLADIAQESDARLSRARRSAAKLDYSGAVDETFSVGGEPLLMDSAVVYVYITHKVRSGVGDKMVLGNQLKTEISEVYDYPVTTADGQPVDVIFGALSVYNRIVNSVFINGTTITLLDVISKKASSLYFGK